MPRASLVALCTLVASCGGNTAREDLPAPQLPQRAGVDPTVAARAEGIEFRAVGEGVVLDIFRAGRIRLTRTATREELIFPKPEPMYPRWSGSIYETSNNGHTLYIEIHDNRECEPPGALTGVNRVVITLDGQQLLACGRSF
jgi:hypothetical protein